jgi:hypothetical protein
VTIGLAVVIDKRRLITGEVTQRTVEETVHIYLPAKEARPAIDAGVGRLAVGQVLGELEDRHQRQPPGSQGGQPEQRVERRELLVGEGEVRMPLGEGGAGDAGGPIGDGGERLRAKRHGGLLMLGHGESRTPAYHPTAALQFAPSTIYDCVGGVGSGDEPHPFQSLQPGWPRRSGGPRYANRAATGDHADRRPTAGNSRCSPTPRRQRSRRPSPSVAGHPRPTGRPAI